MTPTTHATRRRKARHCPAPVKAEAPPVTVPADDKPRTQRGKTNPTAEKKDRTSGGKTKSEKIPTFVPRKKDGTPKKVLTWEDKLRVLDPSANPERTEERLKAFANLFAYRFSDASVTKARGGPGDWTALRGRVELTHVARHLLADQATTLRPRWLATRSFRKAVYFAFDVDAHGARGRRTFERRCGRVEDALRRVGIDPADPLQVLVQPTPSGGRHYYLFFDAPYFLEQYAGLWNALGLSHVPSEIEFYPSESHALRLPFGHLPDADRDPRDWINFTDAYTSRRLKRFNLAALYEAACRPVPTAPPTRANRRPVPHRVRVITPGTNLPTAYLGLPKAHVRSGAPMPNTATAATEHGCTDADTRYLALIQAGPKSRAEAEELFALGIRVAGTRNETLKILAEHLVWFRGLTGQQAAEQLIAWAYDRRHRSEEIHRDMDRGTDRVARRIAHLCQWCETNRKPHVPGGTAFRPHECTDRVFAPAEIEALRPSLASVAPEERHQQAHFLLSFLGFAKRHGQPGPGGNGWEAAPAVATVVRRWPGCNHTAYKAHMHRATEVGLFTMTKEKYQAPPGQKGRARTYRLAVPVVAEEGWTLTYEAALKALTENRTAEPVVPTPAVAAGTKSPVTEELNDARPDHGARDAELRDGNYAPDLREESAAICMGPRASQRDRLADETIRVPRAVDGRVRTVHTDDLRSITDAVRRPRAGHQARDPHPVTPTPQLNPTSQSTLPPGTPPPASTPEPSFAAREAAALGLEDTDFDQHHRPFRSRPERAGKFWVASPLRRNNPENWGAGLRGNNDLRNPAAAAEVPQTTCWNGDPETSPF
jgi:hypothetical protein